MKPTELYQKNKIAKSIRTREESIDFDLYREDRKRDMPRQLARAKYDLTPDAFEQLEEAFIFHYKYAWHILKSNLRSIITFRCSACGHRHLFKDLRIQQERYTLYCVYGWWDTLIGLPRAVYLSGKHGED